MDNTQDLQRQIDELKVWKAEREKQQITLPLDPTSFGILNKYFMSINGEYSVLGGLSGNLYTTYLGTQDNKKFEVTQSLLSPYTVSVSGNTLTVGYGSFVNDRIVYLATSSACPAPLDTATLYYVINSSNNGTTFELSLTSGGAAIDITNTGTGRQFIGYSLN